MDWKYLFTSLEGRIGRKSYWMGVIAMTVIVVIAEVIDLTVRCGQVTSHGIRPLGISVNTKAYGERQAKDYLAGLAHEHGMPATDPIRFGVASLVDALQKAFAG